MAFPDWFFSLTMSFVYLKNSVNMPSGFWLVIAGRSEAGQFEIITKKLTHK